MVNLDLPRLTQAKGIIIRPNLKIFGRISGCLGTHVVKYWSKELHSSRESEVVFLVSYERAVNNLDTRCKRAVNDLNFGIFLRFSVWKTKYCAKVSSWNSRMILAFSYFWMLPKLWPCSFTGTGLVNELRGTAKWEKISCLTRLQARLVILLIMSVNKV